MNVPMDLPLSEALNPGPMVLFLGNKQGGQPALLDLRVLLGSRWSSGTKSHKSDHRAVGSSYLKGRFDHSLLLLVQGVVKDRDCLTFLPK